jgi:hypothetical protein
VPLHTVSVSPLPAWLDAPRLLGKGDWTIAEEVAEASLDRHDAADLAARLRGLTLDGQQIEFYARPRLPRTAVRAARTDDARRRRDTSTGFRHKGARLDEQGRYSLTPEKLALWLGRKADGRSVLDAGCGAGGNAIGFARAGCTVIAVEEHGQRLQDARHNAGLYEVQQHITFTRGDAAGALRTAKAQIAFVDPPWGDHGRDACGVADFPLLKIALAHRLRFAEVWAKVPPSFDTSTVPGCEATAVFGHAAGDLHRIKFVWLKMLGGD